MQLIYRGQTFKYTPAQIQTIRETRAVNWRYQGSSECSGDVESIPIIFSQAGAVNWRWQ
jgi:hypothetical protein